MSSRRRSTGDLSSSPWPRCRDDKAGTGNTYQGHAYGFTLPIRAFWGVPDDQGLGIAVLKHVFAHLSDSARPEYFQNTSYQFWRGDVGIGLLLVVGLQLAQYSSVNLPPHLREPGSSSGGRAGVDQWPSLVQRSRWTRDVILGGLGDMVAHFAGIGGNLESV